VFVPVFRNIDGQERGGRGAQYRLQRDPALKLRSMISESPSGRLVAWNSELGSFLFFLSFGNYYLEGLAAAGLGPMSWWHVSFYFIIFFGS
jgi:hypothetical protein